MKLGFILFCICISAHGQMTNWSTKLSALRAGDSGQYLLKVFGDSWVLQGFITGDVQTNLQAKYGNAGSGFTSASLNQQFYTNIAQTVLGTWSDANWDLTTSDAATPASITWNASCKSATVFWENAFGGTFAIVTNGGFSLTNTNPNNPTRDSGSTLTTFSTDATNAFKVQVLSQFVTIYGAEFRSGSKGIVVDSYGYSGRTANNWANAPYLDLWISNTTPHAVAIMLGVNDVDLGAFAGGNMATNLQTIINRIRAVAPTSDILLISPADVAVTNAGFCMRDVDALMLAMAPTNNCGYFSGYTNMPDYATGNGLGYYLNTKHLNALGASVLANKLVSFLDPPQPPTARALTVHAGTLRSP